MCVGHLHSSSFFFIYALIAARHLISLA
jgi:hypothetical protein